MRAVQRRQLIVLCCLVAVILIYSSVRRTGPIVLPTPWEAESSAGVRAMDAGKLDEAERHFASALDRALLTDSHRMRGTSYQNIGWLRNVQRRHTEARDAYLTALGELQQDPRTPPVQMSALYSGLAIAEAGTRDFANAEKHCRLAIEINEKARTFDDPQTAQDWRNLAAILLVQGRGAEAAGAATRANAIAASPTTSRSSQR
jgi:tetratricopeptide (TPR) repeat protein